MLPRDQAEQLADEVLLHAREARAQRRWSSVPWLLRCQELQRLPVVERGALVSLAQSRVHARHLHHYLWATLSVVLLGALALFANGGPMIDGALAAYILAAVAPSVIYALAFVRPEVKRLAQARCEERYESGL